MTRALPTVLSCLVCFALFSPPLYPVQAAADNASRIVVMIGEDEYKTWETLPAFLDQELKPLGYDIRIVHQDPEDKHNFPGLIEALENADLLVVSVRRRSPPRDQLAAIRQHLAAGKSLIGIRTASHAFTLRAEDKQELTAHPERSEWVEFDREVLGGNYQGHYGTGPGTTITAPAGVADNPILHGIGTWFSSASLYKTSPVAADVEVLLEGRIPGHPPEPLAWTRFHGSKRARVFYTSLGNTTDFAEPQFRHLLVNAVYWALEGAELRRSFHLDDAKAGN